MIRELYPRSGDVKHYQYYKPLLEYCEAEYEGSRVYQKENYPSEAMAKIGEYLSMLSDPTRGDYQSAQKIVSEEYPHLFAVYCDEFIPAAIKRAEIEWNKKPEKDRSKEVSDRKANAAFAEKVAYGREVFGDKLLTSEQEDGLRKSLDRDTATLVISYASGKRTMPKDPLDAAIKLFAMDVKNEEGEPINTRQLKRLLSDVLRTNPVLRSEADAMRNTIKTQVQRKDFMLFSIIAICHYSHALRKH